MFTALLIAGAFVLACVLTVFVVGVLTLFALPSGPTQNYTTKDE